MQLVRFDSSPAAAAAVAAILHVPIFCLLLLWCLDAPLTTGFAPTKPHHQHLQTTSSDSVLRLWKAATTATTTRPHYTFLLAKKKSVQPENATATTTTTTTTSQQHYRDVDLDVKEQVLVNAIEQLLQDEKPKEQDSSFQTSQTTTTMKNKKSDYSKYVSVPGGGDDNHNLNIWDDPALRIVSSEVGIKQFIGEESDDAAVARAILFERTLDTIEDIMVHIRRIPYDMGMNDMPMYDKDQRKTVVVLGSGWASHALMKVADCCKVRLVVVSKSNHFVFTPSKL